MRKKMDGCYTSLLKMATNITWKDKVTNTILYYTTAHVPGTLYPP